MKSNNTNGNAACILCGEPSKENHHPGGRAKDKDLTAPLCIDCHREQTKLQRVAGVELSRGEKPFLIKLQAILMGVGIFLISLGEKMVEWAKKLARIIGVLDFYFPVWREQMLALGL